MQWEIFKSSILENITSDLYICKLGQPSDFDFRICGLWIYIFKKKFVIFENHTLKNFPLYGKASVMVVQI